MWVLLFEVIHRCLHALISSNHKNHVLDNLCRLIACESALTHFTLQEPELSFYATSVLHFFLDLNKSNVRSGFQEAVENLALRVIFTRVVEVIKTSLI